MQCYLIKILACEGCGEWFHPECVKLTSNFKLERIKWWCKGCCLKKGEIECELIIEDQQQNEKVIYKKKISEDKKEEPLIAKKVKTEN